VGLLLLITPERSCSIVKGWADLKAALLVCLAVARSVLFRPLKFKTDISKKQELLCKIREQHIRSVKIVRRGFEVDSLD
jgi:hypothetical protein